MEGLVKLWGCPNTVRRVLRGHNGWACVCFRNLQEEELCKTYAGLGLEPEVGL